MTQYEEWEAVSQRFGVDMEQVRRDHLISFVLGAISADIPTDDIVFFGGTALSRTYCTDARLSEDIDLIALAPRTDLAAQIEDAVRRGLARSHGRPTWRPALRETVASQPATLAAVGTAAIQIQLVGGEGYPWPTEVRDIDQRYSDAPPARLRTLTAPAFAAAKLSAWMDRHAPRDLFDLWAMSERGLIDAAAVETCVKVSPTGLPPSDWVFDEAPDESAWRRALSHQTGFESRPRRRCSQHESHGRGHRNDTFMPCTSCCTSTERRWSTSSPALRGKNASRRWCPIPWRS